MLTESGIKAELCYAYLHAVAARAGFGCSQGYRHFDEEGVDAQITVGKRLHPKSILTDFSFHFALKATSQRLPPGRDHILFPLHVKQYDRLRHDRLIIPRFMVVFQLPEGSGLRLLMTNSLREDVPDGFL